jgi:hypothetical protein
MQGARYRYVHQSAQPIRTLAVADGDGRTRFVWIADLLPHELAPTIAQMIEQGLAVIKRTLETTERH